MLMMNTHKELVALRKETFKNKFRKATEHIGYDVVMEQAKRKLDGLMKALSSIENRDTLSSTKTIEEVRSKPMHGLVFRALELMVMLPEA